MVATAHRLRWLPDAGRGGGQPPMAPCTRREHDEVFTTGRRGVRGFGFRDMPVSPRARASSRSRTHRPARIGGWKWADRRRPRSPSVLTSVGEGNSSRGGAGRARGAPRLRELLLQLCDSCLGRRDGGLVPLRLLLPSGTPRVRALQLGLEILDGGFVLPLRPRALFFVTMRAPPRRSEGVIMPEPNSSSGTAG